MSGAIYQVKPALIFPTKGGSSMKPSESRFFVYLGVLGIAITLAACHKAIAPVVAPAPAPAAAPTPATAEAPTRAPAPAPLSLQGRRANQSAFDPRDGGLYISDGNTFNLYAADSKAVRKPRRGRIYFTDAKETPGSVYELDDGKALPIFTFGTVPASAVYTHTTYVRGVKFDPSGNLYFSESSGAGADGKIYRLDLARQAATLFYTVKLASVGGFWSGDFAFSPDGHLYISSGTVAGGKVFRVDDPKSPSPPVNVYSIPGEPVVGIAFDRSGQFYYSNWDLGTQGHIYQLNLDTGTRKLLFSAPGRLISNVSFR